MSTFVGKHVVDLVLTALFAIRATADQGAMSEYILKIGVFAQMGSLTQNFR